MNDPSPLEAIFFAALEKGSPEACAAYLDEACADDPDLQRRVGKMLAAQAKAGSFLEQPARSPVATVEETPLTECPGTIIGSYKLLEQIGEGGFGVVFMAEQQQPVRRKVAVKVLKPGMDMRQVVARFEAERQALALMDHPNIAKVLDAGQTSSGRPYFVMDLVKGVPITEYCDQTQLTPRARLELFLSVCQAVQHAHQKGIIHRDIKPSNVLVTMQDGAPLVKVIDFGIAKALGQQLTDKTLFTGFAQMIGTPLYMSPEQAALSNVDVDTRSDIYSLGVLLYELLTGTTPFDRERFKEVGYDEIRRIIREEEPPKPSTRISTLGQTATSVSTKRKSDPKQLSRLFRGELDWIVMKALEKDRSRRYETANGFAMDVQRYLADEPVLACPPSASYRLRKFLRRHKGPVLAATLLFLALSAGIIGTTFGMIRAGQALDREEEQRIAAESNANEARSREAETTAVLEFVENKVFAAARPKDQEGGQGHDVKLADAVKAALPFVDKSFTGQPLIEARLRMTMGESFLYLGDAETAIGQYQAARQLYTEHRGADHLDTLMSMNNLAVAYGHAGRTGKAIELQEEILRLRRAKLGPDHPDTLTSMNNLAGSYRDAGRTQAALELHEESIPLLKAKLGPDHPATLMSMNNLANCYGEVGRIQESLELYKETLRLSKVKPGADHLDTLGRMMNLASAYSANGRAREALELREETLPLMKAKLGPNHRDTLGCMLNLALSYAAYGRLQEALKLCEETFQRCQDKLGLDHPLTLLTMDNLANFYKDSGHIDRAIKLHEETLQLRKETLGPHHRLTLSSMNDLAEAYAFSGRDPEALKLHEETLQLRKKHLGPHHPDTLWSLNNLGNTYAAVGRLADALKLLEETLALRKDKLGPDHPDTLWSMGSLAVCLVQLDRGAEAVPIIDDCLKRSAGKVVKPRLIPGVMDLRLRHFEKSKDAAGCRATAAMWEKLKRTDAGSLYDAACMRAVTAAVLQSTPDADAARLAKEEADRAMAWLKQAVAAGFNDAAHMKKDKDLDALRDREDFKKLIAGLEAGKPTPKN